MPRRLARLSARVPAPARLLAAVLIVLSGRAAADELPLHERIDAVVESGGVGPLAAVASDADFLRRVYLDLTGTIPDPATARTFLDDAQPGKRAALIDRLLASPRFARHMQHTFDVMWLERRASAGISDAEWGDYLRASFAANKPLDQLIREILAADGADAALRPAARFYLDRLGEPNLVARDVGRLFFGRDLQCAQCHDHPIVDDYLQSEYYGLMAFVSRGTVFTDKDSKTYYAELADGEVNYKSVFTGEARERVLPELPQGAPVSEPLLSKEEQYVVAPAKDVRPVPKYSRRAQLAQLATCGSSEAFNCNLANRLWAHMLGRGVVHPLDMHHSANPPVQSELLELLSSELVKLKFDLRAVLRELALSRTYQRGSVEPDAAGLAVDPAALAAKLAPWQSEADRLAAELPQLAGAASAAAAARDAAYAKFSELAAAREVADKARAEVKKASDELAQALAAALQLEADKAEQLKVLVAARQAAEAAKAKLPDDPELAAAAALFQKKANETDTALAAARQTIGETRPKVQETSLKLAAADKAVEAATTPLAQARDALTAAETEVSALARRHRAAAARSGDLAARLADARAALECQALLSAAQASQAALHEASQTLAALSATSATATAEAIAAAGAAAEAAATKSAADRAAAEVAAAKLVERATARFALAPLKPLAPEQLAWSTMQALGLVDAERAAQTAEATQQAAAAGEMASEARAALEQRLLEDLVDKKLSPHVRPFVNLFGQQAGQPAAFAATVHQALFLSNGGLLAGWLNPAGDNLTARLAKLDDPQAVADELYLSVLCRRAEADEADGVADYWKAAAADRPAAIREMVWSLVTSAEFRFNR